MSEKAKGAEKTNGTGGLRCPKCNMPYPDVTGVRYDIIYGASDALRLGCRCARCGARFHEWWMIVDDGKKMDLGYVDTELD